MAKPLKCMEISTNDHCLNYLSLREYYSIWKGSLQCLSRSVMLSFNKLMHMQPFLSLRISTLSSWTLLLRASNKLHPRAP